MAAVAASTSSASKTVATAAIKLSQLPGVSDSTTWMKGSVDSVAHSRTIVKSFESVEQGEGVGARVRRSIGRPELRQLDPFLMLDYFSVRKPAGFPDHPHRGQQTVTYMTEGSMEHEDFGGHRGIINPGELQYMTAGRGIVHSEVPGSDGDNKGFQLWVNLSRKDKMNKPDYQELTKDKVPKVRTKDGGIEASVIAGSALGVTSPVHTVQPVYYSDFRMLPGQKLQHSIPHAFNAFLYVLEGSIAVGPEEKATLVPAHHTAVLSLSKEAAEALKEEQTSKGKKKKAAVKEAKESEKGEEKKTDGGADDDAAAGGGGDAAMEDDAAAASAGWEDGVHIKSGKKGARFILVAGEPTNEPVFQHGPFVMASQEEIIQAFRDYQTGRHGFEKARGWESRAVAERRVRV